MPLHGPNYIPQNCSSCPCSYLAPTFYLSTRSHPPHLFKDITLQFMPLFPVSPIFYFLLYNCHKHLRNTVISLICKMIYSIMSPSSNCSTHFYSLLYSKSPPKQKLSILPFSVEPIAVRLLSPLFHTKSSSRITNGLHIDKSNVSILSSNLI